MKLIRSIQKDFNTMTWVLIPVAIAINMVIGQTVMALRLPIFLDSIGTILVAAICGPWAGALTGALSNIIRGLIFDPHSIVWFPVGMFIGFVAGWCANAGLFKSWVGAAFTGVLVSLTSAVAASFISVYLFGGLTGSGSSLITAYLIQTGHKLFQSVLSTTFIVEPADKILTCLLAFAIIRGLSTRYLARFPRPENVEGLQSQPRAPVS